MAGIESADRDVIGLHLAFAAVSALVLMLPVALPVGLRLLGLVLIYNVSLPAFAVGRQYREWFDIWRFLVPLSLFQVFPDWFLAAGLGVIVFPDTGAPMIGPIPVFMAGMWTIPLFLVVWAGRRIEERNGNPAGQTAAALLSGLLFVGSEATLWGIPVWQAKGVVTVFHVGVYLIFPEVLLGLSTFWAYRWSSARPFLQRLWAALMVMILYTGALSFSYLVVEVLLFG